MPVSAQNTPSPAARAAEGMTRLVRGASRTGGGYWHWLPPNKQPHSAPSTAPRLHRNVPPHLVVGDARLAPPRVSGALIPPHHAVGRRALGGRVRGRVAPKRADLRLALRDAPQGVHLQCQCKRRDHRVDGWMDGCAVSHRRQRACGAGAPTHTHTRQPTAAASAGVHASALGLA